MTSSTSPSVVVPVPINASRNDKSPSLFLGHAGFASRAMQKRRPGYGSLMFSCVHRAACALT